MASNLDGTARGKETFSRCSKCDCSWFEEYQVWRIAKHHVVIMGQKPPKVDNGPFIFLRCARCQEIHAPNVTAGAMLQNDIYQSVVKELEEVVPTVDNKTVASASAPTDPVIPNGPQTN